jgi:hypothetical protein
MIVGTIVTSVVIAIWQAVLVEGRLLPRDTAASDVRLLYEYPVGTWIENLAVRSNGDLLLTRLDKPQLDILNPFESKPQPTVLFTFPDVTGVTGIAEIAPDVFALAAGNFSFTQQPGGTLGSWSVWKVDFSSSSDDNPTINRILDVDQALTIDGLTNLPGSLKLENVLVGDLEQGVIRSVDTSNGEVRLVINNPLTAAEADPLFGLSAVNGLRVVDGVLYFTNTAQNIFAKMAIKEDGTPAGEPEVIVTVDKATTKFYFDDFDIQGNDVFLVTGSANTIVRTTLDGGPLEVVAGSKNTTAIAEPTSCRFGRTAKDRNVLYVTTSGTSNSECTLIQLILIISLQAALPVR